MKKVVNRHFNFVELNPIKLSKNRTFKTNVTKKTIGIVNGNKYIECINSLSKAMKISTSKAEKILDFIIFNYPSLLTK